MQAAVAAGYYISLAGTVTFKNAAELRAVAAEVPADRLLIETDCPYLSPVPHRGQRNEPARVRLTAACVADVRGQPLAAVAERTTANAERLFGLTGVVA
jgi:TatD DNase family protein